jgi:hypothetical protein
MMLRNAGDLVEPGSYLPHSRFPGAVNFLRADKRLVCLVEERIGAGPLNIVARGFMHGIRSLEVGPSSLRLDGIVRPLPPRYDSRLAFERPPSPGVLRSNLACLETLLSRHPPPGSLASLSRSPSPRPGFQAALAEDVLRGVECLQAGELEEAARRLKGRGPGLTPGGDDLLAGWLLGLSALESAFGEDFSRDREVLRGASRSRNPFSDALLDCASRGRFFSRAKLLARTLFEGGEAGVEAAGRGLFSVGATSGADLAWGFCLALKAGARVPA